MITALQQTQLRNLLTTIHPLNCPPEKSKTTRPLTPHTPNKPQPPPTAHLIYPSPCKIHSKLISPHSPILPTTQTATIGRTMPEKLRKVSSIPSTREKYVIQNFTSVKKRTWRMQLLQPLTSSSTSSKIIISPRVSMRDRHIFFSHLLLWLMSCYLSINPPHGRSLRQLWH